MELNEARDSWARFRHGHGFARVYTPLLTPPSANAKFGKSKAATYGLALAQSRTSGINVCPHSTPNCVSACVSKNGNGAFNKVKKARVAKTLFWAEHPEAFSVIMVHEITRAIAKHNGNVVFRLNTFSDIRWEETNPEFFAIPGAKFYDYTKDWSRTSLPNYQLTYSATERTTPDEIQAQTALGANVAVVLKVRSGKVRPDMLAHTPVNEMGYRPIPETFHGVPMVDGDASDDRTIDPMGAVIGLRAKGPKMYDLPMALEVVE